MNKSTNGANGANGLTAKKVILDAKAENQVSQVLNNVREHLDKKDLRCVEKTRQAIEGCLTSAGMTRVAVQHRHWPKNQETDFFMAFSFDDTIIEYRKLTRKNLIPQEMTTA